METAVDHTADFLTRDQVDRIKAASVRWNPVESSLALVKPDELQLVKRYSYNKRQLRAEFSCSDICDEGGEPIVFNLAITDDLFERRASEVDDPQGLLYGARPDGPVYLTISLGVPLNGYHYKLVAAVLTEQEVIDASARNAGP